ncbi:MAG: D-glycero-beta-D-manno-heptose-7-phosphate kinase [Candidatus Cloacimonadota bacterium]|nr:D-glycero-beta-D-manno-heptose-7-phosphate kinase [Candidatus Cloacimonadota bacterium]
MKDLLEILERFKHKKIAIIGDIILDKYIYGDVDRISPEAPVPIVKVTREKYVPGGAANVALNIKALGGQAYLLGTVGEDVHKKILFDILTENNLSSSYILTDPKKGTTQKTRVIGLNQQLLRIDHEDTAYLESYFEKQILENINSLPDIDAIIISDYAKGTITKKLMQKLTQYCQQQKLPLIVDPKPKHMNWYKNSFLITPNRKEASQMSRLELADKQQIETAGLKLQKELDTKLIITTGKDGMSVFGENHPLHIPTAAREVYDVSGAGDTVVASVSLAIAAGARLGKAAMLANLAAGIKVGKFGTASVSKQELAEKVGE